MRRIAIVGAGQSGLQLALGLIQRGYEITVVSNRTPEQIRSGRVTSSQFMFHDSLENERELGIHFWESECPKTEGFAFSAPAPNGTRALFWEAKLDHYGQSVDQRLKFSAWLDEFARLGGNVVFKEAQLSDLETLAASNDLVVVAAGKGDVAKLFETDADRTPFTAPMRTLALTYVRNMVPRQPFPAVAFNLIPALGEYFVFPALTITGTCEIMVFEGIPGGPMDSWHEVRSPEAHLQHSKHILSNFVPWEAERCRNIELTDALGTLVGRFAPTVRKPVGELPSGRVVVGIADAVVLNDPITGQGSNTASKAAKIYLNRIAENDKRPFDAAWMQGTFDAFWNYAQWVVKFTNSLLTPPAPHVLQLMGAAAQLAELARRISNAFNDPTDLNPWWFEASEAQKLIGKPAGVQA